MAELPDSGMRDPAAELSLNLSMAQPKLFSYRRCPYAIRVRMALHEKGIEFQVVEEDLKNKSAELLSLHPESRVPLFIHDDLAIYESSVITEYVNEAFPGTNLMPSSPQARAKVRLWTVWCNHILKPEIDRLKYEKNEDVIAKSNHDVLKHLQKLEDALSESDYLVENSFSLADIHLFPFIRQITRIKPDILTSFSKSNSWFERIRERSSFKKAMEK